VSEELATVLSKKGAWEFKELFEMVHTNLRSKDMARGGDEMLRLRAHEKLQNFLFAGIVVKKGKAYSGVPKALEAFFKTAAEFNERFATGTHCHPPSKGKAPVAAPAVTPAPVAKAKKVAKVAKAKKVKLSAPRREKALR
jgi:hypothetical protein